MPAGDGLGYAALEFRGLCKDGAESGRGLGVLVEARRQFFFFGTGFGFTDGEGAAVVFVLAKVAVNGAVMECDLVVFAQVGAYLFGTEFAADKGVDVLNQLRIELIGLSLTLFDSPALLLCFFGTVLLPLGAVPFNFAADGAFVAVKLFGDFGDGAVAGQVLDMVSFVLGQLCVAHGNLSCRKGRMLPHTGLFLLWKVALQMRIRRPFHF